MAETKRTEGDLVAYMHNDGNATIADEIAASPDVAQELAALEKLDALLQRSYGGSALPNPQDLVDVVMGHATPNQRLIVAAYARDSVRGKQELAALENELAADGIIAPQQSSEDQPRLPLFVATLLAGGMGLRNNVADGQADQQTFQVPELQAQVTVRIVPPIREIWQIEGYVTRNYEPVIDAQITLRADQSRPRPRQTDADGFFAFERLAAGTYSMRVAFTDGILVIPDLDLTDEDG